MENLVKKLEETCESYITSLKEKPVSTLVKTLVVIWLIGKVKKLIK